MALGGGTFVTQNKTLPGAYINFVSAAAASATLSDRGIATMPLELDWGKEGEVFEVTNGDFQKNSMEIFGYEYTNDKLKGLRDLFLGARTLYAYRLNGGGTKASNTYAEALYGGTRGNDLKIVLALFEAHGGRNWDIQPARRDLGEPFVHEHRALGHGGRGKGDAVPGEQRRKRAVLAHAAVAAVERDVKAGDDAPPALRAHERPSLDPHGKGRLLGSDDLLHGAEVRRDHAALRREIYGQDAVAPAAQQIAHEHPRDDGDLALVGSSPEKDCDCRHTKNTSEEFFFRRCFFCLGNLNKCRAGR